MQYYTFRFGEQNDGWFEVEHTATRIYMNAIFKLDGEEYENPYTLKLDGNRVLEYKSASCDWTKMPAGNNIYPEAAYPLLVPQLEDGKTFTYQALHEDTHAILGETVLTRRGNLVEETRNGEITRRFWLEGTQITKIDWGRPVSELRPNLAEAKKGSAF